MDLTFTGALAFTAKGSKGACDTTADSFSFEITNAEYPGTGRSFSITKTGTTDGEISFVFDDTRAYESSPNATVTFSSDLKMVEIDDELTPLASGGAPPPAPVHVAGTITCP